MPAQYSVETGEGSSTVECADDYSRRIRREHIDDVFTFIVAEIMAYQRITAVISENYGRPRCHADSEILHDSRVSRETLSRLMRSLSRWCPSWKWSDAADLARQMAAQSVHDMDAADGDAEHESDV